jgi:hypothetical protein
MEAMKRFAARSGGCAYGPGDEPKDFVATRYLAKGAGGHSADRAGPRSFDSGHQAHLVHWKPSGPEALEAHHSAHRDLVPRQWSLGDDWAADRGVSPLFPPFSPIAARFTRCPSDK